MAGLSKKQLEIKNQALMDYIKAAVCWMIRQQKRDIRRHIPQVF